MGAKNSKGNFNRDLQARQSQKKSYNKFRQSVGKLMKNVNKVDYKNKEKLLELEIAVKSLTNDLELAGVDLEEKFQTIHDDFIKKCEEMNVIIKDKLQQNDRMIEELEIETVTNENQICNMDLAIFAEDLEDKDTTNKPKKADKKKKNEIVLVEPIRTSCASDEVVTDVYDMNAKKDKKQKKPKNKENSEDSDACSDITDKNDTLSKKFLSFLRKKKPKIVEEEREPEISSLEGSEIIVIQDPENEHRSEQNIEVNVIQQAIEHKSGKKPKKEKRRSKFYDDELSLPPLPTTEVVHKSDPLSQIENIRETIKTLEEMTWNYRKHKRGNYDYIHDNLCLCIDTLKNLEYDGMLTIRHEKKRAMEDAQQCLDVLEEKVDVPERYDYYQKPQVVVKRSSSARQNSVEFLEISDDTTDDVRVFSDFTTEVSTPERLDFKIDGYEEKAASHYSTDFSEDEDLQNILLSLEEEDLDGKMSNEEKKKPVLITSF